MIIDSKESKTTNCVRTCQRFFLLPYLKLENVAEQTIVLASRCIVRKARCIHYSYVFSTTNLPSIWLLSSKNSMQRHSRLESLPIESEDF